MRVSSRLPGFYQLSSADRLARVAEAANLSEDDVAALIQGGLSVDAAASMVENVIGLHALPFAIAANFTVNGHDVLVPMVVEEPSVVAAAAYGEPLMRDH